MANQAIRQEINLINKQYTGSGTVTSQEISALDTTQFSGTPTYYFEAVFTGAASNTGTIKLRDLTGASNVVSINGATDANVHISRVQFTPTAGLREYTVQMVGDGTRTQRVVAARIIILQNETAVTQTETQIEIGTIVSGLTNTAEADLTNPKFWKYVAANWDGTKTFYVEVTWTTSAKNTCTIKLCRTSDNAANVTIVNAGSNSTGAIRTRVSFTPVDDETYKIRCLGSTTKSNYSIASAKIVVDQEATPQETQTVNSVGDSCQGGTGSSGESLQAIGQSFTAGSSYNCSNIAIMVGKIGSPTDNLLLEVLTGSMSGTVIGTSGLVSPTMVPSTGKWVVFNFSSAISIVSGTQYYLRLTRDGARDTGNYWLWRISTASTMANGGEYTRANNAWSAESSTNDTTFKTFADPFTSVTKLEAQYLLLNGPDSGTGQQNELTTYNASEWDDGSGSTTFKHTMDSDNASNSCKLTDASSGNSDITNSAVTGSGQQVSASLTFTDTHNLDVNVTNSTGVIAASRILVAYVFVGVNNFTSSVSGTLSFASAFIYPWRQLATLSFAHAFIYPWRQLAALSFTGAATKKAIPVKSAAVSFVGVITNKTSHFLSGTLSWLSRFIYPSRQTASISFSGSILKQLARSLSATLSFVGSIVADYIHGGVMYPQALSGTLSFAGSINDFIYKSLTATSSFVGSITKSPARLYQGALNFSPQFTKSADYHLTTGSMSFTGVFTASNLIARALSATLSFTGAISNQISHRLSAAASFIGSIVKSTSTNLSGSASFSGTLRRVIPQLYTASLTFIGAISKRATRAAMASISFVGSFTKLSPRLLSATSSFSGAITKQTSKLASGTLSFVGNLPRSISNYLASVLNFVGLLDISFAGHFFTQLAGTLELSGRLQNRISYRLTAAMSFLGSMTKRMPVAVTGALSFVGSLSRQVRKLIASALSFVGSVTLGNLSLHTLLTGTLTFSSALRKRTSTTLATSIATIGSLINRIRARLSGSLALSGDHAKSTSKLFPADLSFIGVIEKAVQAMLSAVLDLIGDLVIYIPVVRVKLLESTLDFSSFLLGRLPEIIRVNVVSAVQQIKISLQAAADTIKISLQSPADLVKVSLQSMTQTIKITIKEIIDQFNINI